MITYLVFYSFSWPRIKQRQTHLKKCAQVFRIKTENLVDLIKKHGKWVDP